jgi:hypothetical protein
MSMRASASNLLLVFLAATLTLAPASSSTAQKREQSDTLRVAAPALQAARFKPLTTVKIKRAHLAKLPQLRPVITPKSPKPTGPDPKAALDLSDIIEDPGLLGDLSEACGWDGHLIFQDKAAGNVFYYLPREFLLLRHPKGYSLSAQYNYQTERGQPSVMLTAELAAPQRAGDVTLLKAILREALGLKPSDRLDLRSVTGLSARAEMEAMATGLSLTSERIHLSPPAHLKQPFRLSLALTQDEVEEVLAQIAREGLAGSLQVKVGDELVPVPIRIQYSHFAGDRVQGFDDWVKGRPLRMLKNVTDFPLEVTTINAYRLRGDQLERVSKQLKKSRAIPPGGQRPFKLPEVHRVLGDNLVVAWIGTSLDSECTQCLQSVDRAVRKGVALVPRSPIKLEAIPGIFSEFGLYKILIRVRSPYFVAGGGEVQEQEATLTEEENLNADLNIYVPGDRGPNPLLYRYQVQVVTEAGDIVEETAWHDARSLSQFFGASQLEALITEAGGAASQ